MNPYRIAQEEVSGAGDEIGWGETVKVAVDRGQEGIFQISPVCIESGRCLYEAIIRYQLVVDTFIDIVAVSRFGEIGPGRTRIDRGGQIQAQRFEFVNGSQCQSSPG